MIRLTISIDKSKLPSEKLLKPHFQAAVAAVADHWRAKYLPMHFEPSGHFRYGYRPRSKKYLARKERMAQPIRVARRAGLRPHCVRPRLRGPRDRWPHSRPPRRNEESG